MPPAGLEARPEHAPDGREPRSISGAVFDFVVIPFLVTLILVLIYEIVRQLWLVNGHLFS
jgi:hypothetical protein